MFCLRRHTVLFTQQQSICIIDYFTVNFLYERHPVISITTVKQSALELRFAQMRKHIISFRIFIKNIFCNIFSCFRTDIHCAGVCQYDRIIEETAVISAAVFKNTVVTGHIVVKYAFIGNQTGISVHIVDISQFVTVHNTFFGIYKGSAVGNIAVNCAVVMKIFVVLNTTVN